MNLSDHSSLNESPEPSEPREALKELLNSLVTPYHTVHTALAQNAAQANQQWLQPVANARCNIIKNLTDAKHNCSLPQHV